MGPHGPHSTAEHVSTRRAIFNPPLSCQRYQWVESFLKRNTDIKSLTDVGCGNGKMVNWIKTVPHIRTLNCLDSDANLLDSELDHYFRPNLIEMLFGRRSSKLDIVLNVYQGDIIVPDDRLHSDCFTMVEVIEHIDTERIADVSRIVFGYYRPKYVVVSTPNIETNNLLRYYAGDGLPISTPQDTLGTNYRHHDHKFEWTRQQFCEWAKMISDTYGYDFEIDGVGNLPNGDHLGPCTQIATFRRHTGESRTASSNASECFDLLMNKLSVQDSHPEFEGDRSLKRICLMASFRIPGASSDISQTPYTFWDDNLNNETSEEQENNHHVMSVE